MIKTMQLFLGGVSIPKFCSLIRKANSDIKIIGLKMPVNYNQNDLLKEAKCNVASMCSYGFRKQILVVLDYWRSADWLNKVHSSVMRKLPGVKACVHNLATRDEPGGGLVSPNAVVE